MGETVRLGGESVDEQIMLVAVVFVAGFVGWVIGRTTANIKASERGSDRANNKKRM